VIIYENLAPVKQQPHKYRKTALIFRKTLFLVFDLPSQHNCRPARPSLGDTEKCSMIEEILHRHTVLHIIQWWYDECVI